MNKIENSIPLSTCSEYLIELATARKLLKFLLQENVPIDESWDNDLVPLLCEYYSTVRQQIQFFLELVLTKPITNESTSQKEFTLSSQQTYLLNSLNSLLYMNDVDLRTKYNISLTIH
tara:strand:- start:3738 stop:4091 length:354 start_codon:yes stop_codon:yes gene_type:complete